MARLQGLTGKLTGKYGNAVFRVRRGTQVMAQYNPEVDNPNTDKQVNARARFKLMTQLSAIFAPIIAIPRDGAVTARNLFLKGNFALATANQGKAEIDLPQVQLTKSAREMAPFTVSRSSGDGIAVSLIEAQLFSRVIYAVVAKNANEKLRVFASEVVENGTPGEANTFATKLPYTAEAIVVYAYAISDNNGRATAAFGEIHAPTAQEVAALIASRSVSMSDVSMSQTGGAYLEVGTTDAVSGINTPGGGSVIPQVPTIGGYSPFAEFTDVVLSAQSGALIHYTLDGSMPTQASRTYSEPIRITETTTVKAIAVVNGVSSNVSTRTLAKEVAPVVVLAPTISGTTPFSQSTQVTISAEAGAAIFYTLDGTTPTEASTSYQGAITLTETTTVKAIARLQNTNSAVSSRTFEKGGGESE